MQNRLDGATEALVASEKQLAELRSAIAAERAARPESVNPPLQIFQRRPNLYHNLLFFFFFYWFFVSFSSNFFFRINVARHSVDWLLRGKR